MNIATLRYKLYRYTKFLTLGKLGGKALGINVCRCLEEGRASPTVAAHIVDSIGIASPCVVRYPFPKEFPPEFIRETAFDAKTIYHLHDIIVAPGSGLIWIPGGPILQESAGSLPRLFNGRIKDTLRTPVALSENAPVVVFPSFGYYHVLFDALPNVLHALSHVPNAKLLLPVHRARYVDSILDFLGIPQERRLMAENPVIVKNLVFSPTWVNGGFVPPVDLAVLRETILPRINSVQSSPCRIYISRSHCGHRPITNETCVEKAMSAVGFSVVYLEDLTFSEQMSMIHGAKIIVAPHGAGLANLVAARPGTKVLEFLSRSWFNTCYAKLAVQLGCDYQYLESVSTDCGHVIPMDVVQRAISKQ